MFKWGFEVKVIFKIEWEIQISVSSSEIFGDDMQTESTFCKKYKLKL